VLNAPKMHPDELDIDADLVARLIDTQFPEWAGQAIEPLIPWGTDNAMFQTARIRPGCTGPAASRSFATGLMYQARFARLFFSDESCDRSDSR
jgi:hypothetical protein